MPEENLNVESQVEDIEQVQLDIEPDLDAREYAKLFDLTPEQAGLEPDEPDVGAPEPEEPDSDEDETEEKEAEEADIPERSVEDRFKEYEQKFDEPEVDTADPEAQVKQFEQAIEAEEAYLNQNHWLKGLPDYRSGEGVSIYDMPVERFDEYLQELQDEGKNYLAKQVADARTKAVDNYKNWNTRHQTLESAKQEFARVKDVIDWQKVEKQWVSDIPEIKQFVDDNSIAQFIKNKAQKDLTFAAELNTFNGKMKAVYQAVRDLRLMEKISENQPKAEITKPSAPDTKTASKKVKRNSLGDTSNKLERAATMTQAEFNSLSPAEIDDLLGASFGL